MGDSERAVSRSTDPTPPPVSDAIRILQDYVGKRHLRLHDVFTQVNQGSSSVWFAISHVGLFCSILNISTNNEL